MAQMPRLTAVEDELTKRRDAIRNLRIPTPEPTVLAAMLFVVGLAAIAVSVAMVYLPAGIFVAGLELAAGAITYTRGAKRVEADRPRRRRRHG